LGAGRWAAHAIVIATAMVFFAGLVARRDGEDRRRAAYFALSAMTMISFALTIILTSTALTIALACMVLLAALIDQRLNLKLLTVLMQVGAVVAGWRLIVDPGLPWAEFAPIWELIFGYGAGVALLAAAWWVLGQRQRLSTMVVVESAAWLHAGVLGAVLM
jgi:hypothetical protein